MLLPLTVGNTPGETDVVLSANAGPFADQVTRKLKIQPLGFPVEIARAGTLDGNDKKQHKITIPQTIIKGSLSAKIAVYPTPMASLTGALESLIQEPYGCFEQTSSSTYPLVMAQQYFQSHAGIDPELIKRSNEMLGKGYQRLTGYECKGGGYEWFGEDPGHEALTAYGLMEFSDMAQVFPVDTAMLARTREWLLKQRDGNGGFNRAEGHCTLGSMIRMSPTPISLGHYLARAKRDWTRKSPPSAMPRAKRRTVMSLRSRRT